jgi:hypothetical protein
METPNYNKKYKNNMKNINGKLDALTERYVWKPVRIKLYTVNPNLWYALRSSLWIPLNIIIKNIKIT